MLRVLDGICCRIVQNWLIPRSEGLPIPLPAYLVNWITDHIERCIVCRTDIAHLRLTSIELRRARNKNGRGSLDPTFANRVMDRVQREEALQNIAFRHRRNTAAVLSAGVVLAVGLCVSSGFNPLHAAWFTRSVRHRPFVSAAQPVTPPFAYHDPFLPNYYSSDGEQALDDLRSVIGPTDVRTRWRRVGRHKQLVQVYVSFRPNGAQVENVDWTGFNNHPSSHDPDPQSIITSRLK